MNAGHCVLHGHPIGSGSVCCCVLSLCQILNEGFLEDINNVLNTGEVPNLFQHDEKEKILQEVRPVVTALGLQETRDSIYGCFIDRVRDNLHICVCMSPVGDKFRNRCRMFPSLINCCTIDWYEEWTPSALLSVSQQNLEKVKLGSNLVKQAIANLCVDVHANVGREAERYFLELRRHYYVTPKTYLDLISSYEVTLEERRADIEVQKGKLDTGLGTIACSAQPHVCCLRLMRFGSMRLLSVGYGARQTEVDK